MFARAISSEVNPGRVAEIAVMLEQEGFPCFARMAIINDSHYPMTSTRDQTGGL